MVTGEAAGTAAALAVKQNLPVQNVPAKALQQELVKHNVVISEPDL
jgi:hypothetical protein